MICDYYLSVQSEQEETVKPKDMSIEGMFYEFMKHKSNEVNGGTIKRMMAAWVRFYGSKKEFIAILVTNLTKINIDDFFNAVLVKHSLKNNPSNTEPLAVMLDFELRTRKGEILAI